MKLANLLHTSIDLLKAQGFDSPRLDVELLFGTVLKMDRTQLYLNGENEITGEDLKNCIDFLERRQRGEPVAYILGSRDFYKSNFVVTPEVLIPRPETEHLVELASEWLSLLGPDTQPRIVDLGSGSGCIGLSLLVDCPSATLLSVDLSPAALEVTQLNAHRLKVHSRTRVWAGDVATLSANYVQKSLGDKCDVVVANPPYIRTGDPAVDPNVREFEPEIALFAGPTGLECLQSWSQTAARILKPQGACFFEIGYDQGPKAREIFESTGAFESIQILKDYGDHDRVVSARRL